MNTVELKKNRPYFIWDYDYDEDDIRAMLSGDDEYQRAWAIGRILCYAKYEDVWKYVTVPMILRDWPRLSFWPKELKATWMSALKVWGFEVEHNANIAHQEKGRHSQVKSALAHVTLPSEIVVREWTEADFTAVQQLSQAEKWSTPTRRPDDSLTAWLQSWPALVATHEQLVVGFLRALTDGFITTYVAELLVERSWRGKGIGRALIETCHHLYPKARLDLLSKDTATEFYKANGFWPFQGFRKSEA